jgi:hypothetical protein
MVTPDDASGTVFDPLLVILPIVTVLLTAGGAIFGAWIQGRREHARWVRDRRADAYLDGLKQLRAWARLGEQNEERAARLTGLRLELRELDAAAAAAPAPDEIARLAERVKRLRSKMKTESSSLSTDEEKLLALEDMAIEKLTALKLLGPERVNSAAQAIVSSRRTGGAMAVSEKLAKLEQAMRTALEVKE